MPTTGTKSYQMPADVAQFVQNLDQNLQKKLAQKKREYHSAKYKEGYEEAILAVRSMLHSAKLYGHF